MGKNTYNRNFVNDTEILNLVKNAIDNPLKSIWSDRTFETEKQWRANVARYLDADSSRRFYFYLATHLKSVYCEHCKKELTIDSFNKTYTFDKFCPTCKDAEIWKTAEYLGPETLKNRGNAIAKQKLEFYQTNYGKNIAKEIGVKNSANLKKFFNTEQGLINREKSRILNREVMREKILNGTFTPNSNNRNTHWDSYYENKKYRSSWEAIYQYFYPNDEHEKLRIPYYFNGKRFIYIVDFINYATKIVTEVKPRELCKDTKFIEKYKALQQWALENNFTVRIADLEFITSHPIPANLNKFDQKTQEKIIKIYEKAKNQINQNKC